MSLRTSRASAAAEAFLRLTGHPPDALWCAPGRVNLIGEHTDYNDGLALPVAIDRAAAVAVGRRGDGMVRCVSAQVGGEAVSAVAGVLAGRVRGWAAYPLGVVWALGRAGVDVPGLDVVIDSAVPVGAGLGSSAAVGVALGLAVAELTGAQFGSDELARLCQSGEEAVAGAPTGLMDQLPVLDARAGHALFLDCRTLAREQVPFALGDAGAALLVIDTTLSHATSGAGYRTRRDECAEAARILAVASLRDATLDAVSARLDGRLLRRARHVVTENDRVARVAALLREGRLRDVGPILDAGHASLRDDYQVSSEELDLAVESAREAGAWGARMTGAGFGGCAIALVAARAVGEVSEAVDAAFARSGHARPAVFTVAPCGGAAPCA